MFTRSRYLDTNDHLCKKSWQGSGLLLFGNAGILILNSGPSVPSNIIIFFFFWGGGGVQFNSKVGEVLISCLGKTFQLLEL